MQEFRKEKELPFIYSINLLFGHKGKQSSQFVYQKMIQNVPVIRLLQIAVNASELEKSMAQLFNEEVKKWSIKVNDVYQIFPKRGEEWKSFVELFSSMLNGTRYSRERVVKKALLYAKILRYRTETVYELKKVSDDRRREELMCRGLLKYAIFLKLLENIGVIKMNANEMLRSISGIEEDIKRFIEMQGFQEWQAGLFLLGTLLGNIGVEQYKKGDKKKSILDKVNFDGCSTEKVKYLANVALEGLKNYRILAHTEGTYAIMKEILDRNLDKLTNPVDNTYYILSGYAFITLRVITSGGERHE
jgi:CRISPR-associated protein Csh1